MKLKHMVAALLAIGVITAGIYAVADQQLKNRKGSPDIILIDSMKVFGELERPGVPFPHDQHTDALEKQGKDCSTCHETEDKKLVLKFKRASDFDKDTVLDIYHTNCITCHEEHAAEKKDTGPLECGSCHPIEPETVAEQQPIQFDASLHHRHINASDNTCDNCHHGYDAVSKQKGYVKGEEESCRTCHGEKRLDKAASYREVAHIQCISCHLDKKGDNGIKVASVTAVKCAGCHDAGELALVEKLDTIPRLDRNQPDLTFVKSFDPITTQMMDAVIFDHKKHETENPSCNTCHHDTLKSCDSCHTLSGSKEGGGVSLARAMHDINSEKSCVGCHNDQLQTDDCAGCHALIRTQLHVTEGQSCQSCHRISAGQLARDKKAGRDLAAKNYRTDPVKDPVINYQELPEEIMIDVMSKEYKGAFFPHRTIVETMMNRIEGNPLAMNFHQGKNRVCQSCHHNSPDNMDPPPSCISCHAASETEMGSNIPDMKAAYHLQCFSCHDAMGITKPVSTDCVDCHEEK